MKILIVYAMSGEPNFSRPDRPKKHAQYSFRNWAGSSRWQPIKALWVADAKHSVFWIDIEPTFHMSSSAREKAGLMMEGVPAFSCLPVRQRPATVVLEILTRGKMADLIHEGRKKLFERKGAK